MNKFSKISFKKPVRLLLSTVVVAIFLITLIAASRDQNTKAIKGLNIHLNDKSEFSYLRKKDIQSWLLSDRKIDLSRHALANLDLKKMETLAEEDPWIANAEVYVDKNRTLQIEVTQRSPVVRIFDASGHSYYLDSTTKKMPLSSGYAFPATVFTNVPVYKSARLNQALYKKIVYLSKVINADSFWKAQITQVDVRPNQTFIAYGLLGDQQIIIGDTNNIHEKLFNLFAFYKHVPQKIGWNTYETLDLRYKGQVVAAPSLNTPQAQIWESAAKNIKTTAAPRSATEDPPPKTKAANTSSSRKVEKKTPANNPPPKPKYLYKG